MVDWFDGLPDVGVWEPEDWGDGLPLGPQPTEDAEQAKNWIAEILLDDEVIWSATNSIPQQRLTFDVSSHFGKKVLKFRIRGLV